MSEADDIDETDDDDEDDDADGETARTPAEIRAAAMTALRKSAAKLFAKRPTVRSVMMSVAQYWADEADDAVHSHLIASERETPIWPHTCDLPYDDEADRAAQIPGELCWDCAEDIGYLPLDENGSAILGFEAFCSEDASQEESTSENYQPYAIARRRGDGVDIEVVGVRRRRLDDPIAKRGSRKNAKWPDERSRELFAQVCATPSDDGPRHVLADHLIERGDARGELLALSLGNPDAEGRARRDSMIETHLADWIHPLGVVIPIGGARFSRGFLVHADILVTERADVSAVRGAAAWGTVESLRYLSGTLGVLDPAMIALREVGVILQDQIVALAEAPRPWSIESLQVFVDDLDLLRVLRDATTLPKLRHLTVSGEALDHVVAELPQAAWWGQLDKLTVLSPTAELANWQAHPSIRALPAFAIGSSDDLEHPAGWHIAAQFAANRAEVTLPSWHGRATFGRLAQALAKLPAGMTVTLAPTPCYQPTDADRERLGILVG